MREIMEEYGISVVMLVMGVAILAGLAQVLSLIGA